MPLYATEKYGNLRLLRDGDALRGCCCPPALPWVLTACYPIGSPWCHCILYSDPRPASYPGAFTAASAAQVALQALSESLFECSGSIVAPSGTVDGVELRGRTARVDIDIGEGDTEGSRCYAYVELFWEGA